MKKKILGILIFVLATIGVGVLNIKNTYAEEAWSINIGSEYRKDTELTGFNDQQPKEYTYSIGTLKKDAKGKFSWKNSSNDHVITGKLDSSKKNLIITVDYNKVKCSKVYKVAYPNCEKTINNKKQSLTYSVPLKKSEKKMAKSLKDVLSGKEIKIRAVSTSSKTLGSVKEIHTFRFNEKSLGIVDILNVSDTKKTNNKTDSTEETCMNSDGAKSLGWIVCPIMDWMNDASNKLYDDYVKPALEVQPKLFTGTSGDNTWDGWDTFRNIANTLMIILFLFVIFSQLTGVGIDNYGIKKILPKLITAAILMNLSYWICVILIDTSNIFGNGLQGIFDGLAANLDGLNVGIESKQAELGTEAGALVSAGVISTLFSGGIMVWSNPAILLTLFISLLGVMVSIFFLFIILAVREAAIVVLVVLSPLAVACMMLPNTKSWFDKWGKFFGSLLMVYPIAGVLVGGGNYVSKLLLSAGTGTFWTFTAMLAGIVPIFFIPTVLRNSLAMAGNLGAKISGIGARVGGGVQRGAANSGINRNLQERGLERQTRIRGGIDKNGNPVGGRRRVIANVLSGGSRARQRNALRYQKMVAERGSLEAADAPEFMTATQTANIMKELNASGEINDMGSMNNGGSGLTGGLYNALMSGDKARIRAYTDALSAKGEDGRDTVKTVFNKAVNDGMSDESARVFSDNIMSNHAADYKNNNRSLFAVAQGISSADRSEALGITKQTTTQYLSSGGQDNLAGKVTANTIGNMDASAFHETFGSGGGLKIPDDKKESIGAAAYSALYDQNANVKPERAEELKKLIEQSGYKPSSQLQAENTSAQLEAINQQLSNLQVQSSHPTQSGPMPQQAGPHPINNSGPGNGGPGVINIPH